MDKSKLNHAQVKYTRYFMNSLKLNLEIISKQKVRITSFLNKNTKTRVCPYSKILEINFKS